MFRHIAHNRRPELLGSNTILPKDISVTLSFLFFTFFHCPQIFMVHEHDPGSDAVTQNTQMFKGSMYY